MLKRLWENRPCARIVSEHRRGRSLRAILGAINMWSSQNAGKLLDLNAEIELWTRAGHIKIKVGKGADIRRLDQLIA